MEKLHKLSAKALLRPAMLTLYLLNLTDLLFTKFLLNTGLFFEANPIMAAILQNPTSVFAIKLLLPALLMAYLDYRTAKADEKNAKVVFWVISALNSVYIFVIALHIFLLSVSGYFF